MMRPFSRKLTSWRLLFAEEKSYRFASILAWGRNVEGQCGQLPSDSVLEPQKIKRFDVLGEVTDVAAGRQHSAAILSSGEMYTWGSGSCGKLGHSDNAGNCCVPTLVGSLAARKVKVSGAALGQHHSLVVDGEGRLHGFGENKEGQCGLGTPLELLARQQRQEWSALTDPTASIENRIGFGQIRTPTPIPRGTTTHQTSPGGDEEESGELGSRKVDQASASTYFSIAKTADGEVWTCGAGFLGELGHAKTWSPAFCQVAGGLRESLRQRGGATSIAAGGTFAVALTAEGQALVWGQLGTSHGAETMEAETPFNVVGTPSSQALTAVAAGRLHALVSDGCRVWAFGKGALGTGGGGEHTQIELTAKHPGLLPLRPP
ncbi:hypothetical protein CYMTET_19514, partial [Cymbomonas tetramitiformis]